MLQVKDSVKMYDDTEQNHLFHLQDSLCLL
jgi:hypothetical protein